MGCVFNLWPMNKTVFVCMLFFFLYHNLLEIRLPIFLSDYAFQKNQNDAAGHRCDIIIHIINVDDLDILFIFIKP